METEGDGAFGVASRLVNGDARNAEMHDPRGVSCPRPWRFIDRLALVSLALAASPVVADDGVLKQSWENVHRYGGVIGLSPLYEAAGVECQRILARDDRWMALPRPINHVLANPDDTPCFEMHSGDSYYNDLKGNTEGIRWANEQTWNGSFRLFYNTKLVARDGDDYWLLVDGSSSSLRRLSGNKWSNHWPPGTAGYQREAASSRIAKVGDRGWCVATSEGAFLFDGVAWERLKIPRWPGGAVQGAVGDGKGRIAVWSYARSGAGSTIALLAGNQWQTSVLPSLATPTQLAIRPDGKVVVAGLGCFTIVVPRVETDDERNVAGGVNRQPDIEHLRQGHFDLGDHRWVQVFRTPAVSRHGGALFVARDLGAPNVEADRDARQSTRARSRARARGLGLVRVPVNGQPEWIDLQISETTQIAPWINDGFLLMAEQQGIYLLQRDVRTPVRVGDAAEVLSGDKLLGGDPKERAYIQRDHAILVFNYQVRRTALIQPEGIARLENAERGEPDGEDSPAPIEVRSAIDAAGNCWFISSDKGAVLVQRRQSSEPQSFDRRLRGVRSIWPGRNDSLLMLGARDAALVHDTIQVERADSLVELAKTRFSLVRAAAPLQSNDPRRYLLQRHQNFGTHQLGPPWLCTGKCVWISDGESVYRILNTATDEKETGPIAVEKICTGGFDILGPLRSGGLLLAKRVPAVQHGNATVTDWHWIEDPDGRPALRPVESPPREYGRGSLERPASVERCWLSDANGSLYLHQGFDRVYRINAQGKWPMLTEFGVPQIEYPEGVVWAWHGSRVFPGYEVAADGFRRSCIPTYMENVTPLFAHKGFVYCMTPLGSASLRFDRNDATQDKVVNTTRIAWPAPPIAFIGHVETRAFIVTSAESGNNFISVEVSKSAD